MQFTQEQIVNLAPDQASVQAGKGLATASKWVVRCVHERALWGDCQGSGSNPYKTIVDLNNLAFKCSCPSRKFPCKHGLGLLFLYAANPSVFSVETELPSHVAEWLDKRETKAEPKAAIPEKEKVPDEAAQQKRAEAREKKVSAGINELQLWLKDVVRTGIMNVPQNPYQFNQNITARMVDSQAGGLANQLRKINKINFYKEGWQKQLIKQLGKTYLLSESYKNIHTLPEILKQEIRTQIGWNTAKEDVLNSAGTVDKWFVLSISVEEEANLRTERIWLYGISSQKFALILNFYAGNLLPTHTLIEGTVVEAELVYFPSAYPLRALIKELLKIQDNHPEMSSEDSILALYEKVASVLSENPFAEQIPIMFANVKIFQKDNVWYISDTEGNALHIMNHEDDCWTMISISQGKAFFCFGIYENEAFDIYSVWANGQYYIMK